jgi:CheY-like chemotaxis protein
VLKRKDVIKVIFSAYNKKNKQSHDLQKQLEFKEDYLSIVSRDIQTPLHVITLSCDYLLSHKDQLTEEQLSFLDRILRNSDNAMNVIANVLKHARVESGFTLQIEATQIDSLLTEASSALQAIAASKLCRLSIRCDRSFEIDIDRMRMLHVLQNLVANITHFAKEGSTICLDVSIIEISKIDSLRIRVYEKFINSSKVIEEVEFFQDNLDEDQDIVRTFGLGIGLAVVRKFVQLHNGDMNIQMGEDKNSFVEVVIPGVKLVCDLKREDPNKVKILLVEDDDDIRDYFKEEFELAGMEVICARNGEEGANCFYRYRPDIVFSDIRMPVRDGFELLAEVRADDPACPFVFCSGYYPNLYNELEKSDYKADLFINKPVSGQKLLECIGPLIDRVKMAA